MDFTQRKAIWYEGLPTQLPIWDDVGGIEQLRVPEAAERALVAVGFKHPYPKRALMEAYIKGRCDVAAAGIIFYLTLSVLGEVYHPVVNCH